MDFLTALKKRKAEGLIPVIPDIKCFSPKEGDLLRGRDPVRLAQSLEAAGACAVSVVTEQTEFHGSMDLLREICRAVSIPVLRKDFVETAEDLAATKRAGASAILLMYSCLGRERLEALYAKALDLGLVPFVETHTAQELEWAADLGAGLVGINNRNILELERDDGDVGTAENLMGCRPPEAFLVVESGLTCGADARRAVRCGGDAVLVGTAILQAPDPAAMYRSMTRPCDLKICGLMDREGIRICRDHLVDILGFVVEYPVPVPWNLTREEAAPLIAFAKNKALSAAREGTANPDRCESSGRQDAGPRPATCIVTGGSPDQVIGLAGELRPDLVQLHYRETAEDTSRIAEALRREGISVIRSIPSDAGERRQMFGTEDLTQIAAVLARAGVEGMLLDSRDAGNAAAGGGSILDLADPDTLAEIRRRFPGRVLLGGGLTAANIRKALRTCRPDTADVMTGVETAPGRKSEAMVIALTGALETLEED